MSISVNLMKVGYAKRVIACMPENIFTYDKIDEIISSLYSYEDAKRIGESAGSDYGNSTSVATPDVCLASIRYVQGRKKIKYYEIGFALVEVAESSVGDEDEKVPVWVLLDMDVEDNSDAPVCWNYMKPETDQS